MEITIEDGVNGGVLEETYIRQAYPTTNYDSQADVRITILSKMKGFIKVNFPTGLGNITVLQSYFNVYHSYAFISTNYFFRVLRDWKENEVTWNNWKSGELWTIAGAESEGNDISAQIGSKVFTADLGWQAIPLSASITKDMYSKPSTNFGILITCSGENRFYSDKGTYPPQFYMEYIVPDTVPGFWHENKFVHTKD